MERDFKGVWIPKEIWLCQDLSALDKVLYAEISSLDNENHCTASNEYFAEFCGVGVATVTRSIQKLIDRGYIEKVSFDGRTRVIKLIKQTNQIDESPSSKRLTNNIDNNTSNKSILSKDNIPSSDSVCYDSSLASKQYTKEDYKDEFLGSAKRRKQAPKKTSLYSNCSKEITNYCISNNCVAIADALHTYLSLRLSMKDKPIYNVAQWKAMLVKLDEVVSQSGATREEVINQSIEHGWASFYPPKSSRQREVFSEYGQVTCEKSDGKESSGVEF